MELYQFGPVPASRGGNTSADISALYSHPELYYEGSDIVMMLLSSAQVLLMIPGISLVYAGVADPFSALTLLRVPLITTAFVGVQWYLWGYTLTFSPSAGSILNETVSWYGGDIRTSAFRDFSARPVGIQGRGLDGMTGPKIPELVYGLYQGMFACFTASLVAGGIVRKAPIGRFLFFISIWSVVVYNPVARWTWHPQGWSRMRGVMDFAGGTAVHICSGATVAAYCVFFQMEIRGWKPSSLRNGKWMEDREKLIKHENSSRVDRKEYFDKLRMEIEHLAGSEPHSIGYVVLGTTLLWVGWFGFNGGSALGANLRAASAILATHVAACAGASVGLLLEWVIAMTSRVTLSSASIEPPSILGFCDGAISGLVAITPAAGFVPVKTASVFGVTAAIVCKLLRFYVRKWLLPYDILDICAVHAGGGFVGMFLAAVFVDDVVTGLDGYSLLTSRTFAQRMRNQMLDVTTGFFYSFFATFAILLFLKGSLIVFRPLKRQVKQRVHFRLYKNDEEYAKEHERRLREDQEYRNEWNETGTKRVYGPDIAVVLRDKLMVKPQHKPLKSV